MNGATGNASRSSGSMIWKSTSLLLGDDIRDGAQLHPQDPAPAGPRIVRRGVLLELVLIDDDEILKTGPEVLVGDRVAAGGDLLEGLQALQGAPGVAGRLTVAVLL